MLILDEPASGLDPRARIEMRELLRELKTLGKTIFFSSHILSEVADICSSIAILEAGKLIAHGDIEEMKKRLRSHRLIQLRVLGETELVQKMLVESGLVLQMMAGKEYDLPEGTVRFDFSGNDQELSQLLGQMMKADIPIVSFSEETGDLEDVFLHVTQGIVQ